MKRLILITASVLFLGATASFAQTQDTTGTRSRQSQTQPTQQPTQSDQLKNRSNMDQDLKGWSQLNTTDVPANLRQTLGGQQYSGWDQNGKLYRNEAGDMYSLRMGDQSNQKIYYFDKNGKAVKKPDQ